MILVIFALAGAAGAAYYYIKFVKGRKLKDEDMDFFDYEGYEEEPVSYTHLDVYKRQPMHSANWGLPKSGSFAGYGNGGSIVVREG